MSDQPHEHEDDLEARQYVRGLFDRDTQDTEATDEDHDQADVEDVGETLRAIFGN